MTSIGAKLRARGEKSFVLIDTCVFLGKGILICEKLQEADYPIATIPQVVKEVKRKLKKKSSIKSGNPYPLISSIEIITITPQIMTEAMKIWAHFPDNILIASAKFYNAALLSYDQVLHGIAKYEGVQAYTPEQFFRILTYKTISKQFLKILVKDIYIRQETSKMCNKMCS